MYWVGVRNCSPIVLKVFVHDFILLYTKFEWPTCTHVCIWPSCMSLYGIHACIYTYILSLASIFGIHARMSLAYIYKCIMMHLCFWYTHACIYVFASIHCICHPRMHVYVFDIHACNKHACMHGTHLKRIWLATGGMPRSVHGI